MNRSTGLICALAIAFAVGLVCSAPAGAGGWTPVPTLAKPKGESCVEPRDVIRRNHMDLLKEQRDLTMHQGIRGGKYSIRKCVECHASPDPAYKDEVVLNVSQFCDQCHTYAGAQPDCWTCHNPVLDKKYDRMAWDQREDPQTLIARLTAQLKNGSAPQ